MPTHFHPTGTHGDQLRMVDAECLNGSTTRRGNSYQQRASPLKMVRPYLRLRIEKRHQLAAHRIITFYLDPFERITHAATETSIALIIRPTGAFGNDVFKFKLAVVQSPTAVAVSTSIAETNRKVLS